MNDTLYYSCFFGYSARTRRGLPGANGITAAIIPETGQVLWLTTRYSVTAGATISAKDGRLYLGGYNRPNENTETRHVWCLDAQNGSLIWQSDPLKASINGVAAGEKFLFTHAYGADCYIIDKDSGKIQSSFNEKYHCTRFTLSGPYIMGANMDIIDSSKGNRYVSS